MCGIVGYIGKNQAAPILLEGLSKLEYRGYDSAGIAVYNNNELEVAKSKGKLAVLSEKIDGGKKLGGNMGIGHTRWALIFHNQAVLPLFITVLSKTTFH